MELPTIGADPELFVRDNHCGEIVPIIGLLGGTKRRPLVSDHDSSYAFQEDNVMAEYNVPPSMDPYDFAHSISFGRTLLLDQLNRQTEDGDKYSAADTPSHQFSDQDLDHRQARTFGCSPDFDAYRQGAQLPTVSPAVVGNWRFAGGHVHLGYKGFAPTIPEFVVAALCDAFVSINMIRHGMDWQGERRRFYGTAGRYRPTPYGIEYRTLSNQWTLARRGPEFVADSVWQVFGVLENEEEVRQLYNELPWVDIARAINREDRAMALDLFAAISTIRSA